MRHIVLALAVVAGAGCASTMNSGPDGIPVATNPAGAFVYVDGNYVGQSPTTVWLDRDRAGVIQIYLPGFEPLAYRPEKHVQGWFFANAFLWPGFIIDLVTGDYRAFDDDDIAVGLTPTR